MSERNDGGPVFPGTRTEMVKATIPDDSATSGTKDVEQPAEVTYPGISLRDWYAGQALAGLSAIAIEAGLPTSRVVETAYAAADAMLAERSK